MASKPNIHRARHRAAADKREPAGDQPGGGVPRRASPSRSSSPPASIIDFPPLREAALAALLTCLCDPGGPIGRRVPVLLSFTFIGALVTAGFGLVRELGPAIALPLGVFGLFCSSFARIYGQAPQQLGVLLSTVQILALDRGDPSVTQAAIVGLSFIGGGLWATLLTLVIWRIYPFLPARKALSAVFPPTGGAGGAICTAWCGRRRPATPTGTRMPASTAAPPATRSRPPAP